MARTLGATLGTGSQKEDYLGAGPSRDAGMSKAPKKAPRKNAVRPAAASRCRPTLTWTRSCG